MSIFRPRDSPFVCPSMLTSSWSATLEPSASNSVAPRSVRPRRAGSEYDQRIDQPAHALPMRAFPEHALATITDGEALVALAHSRRQLRCDLRLVDRTQRRVAAQTARERLRRASEVESIEHLAQLQLAAQCAHIAAMRDGAALQQVAVPRQHDASLRGCQALDLAIVEVVVVQSVDCLLYTSDAAD